MIPPGDLRISPSPLYPITTPIFVMKISPVSCLLTVALISSFALVATTFADVYTGKVNDDDPADGILTVTSEVDESTKEFQVSAETSIVGADGKPSQLMNLISGTRVTIDVDAGPANVAKKITVLPDASQQVP